MYTDNSNKAPRNLLIFFDQAVKIPLLIYASVFMGWSEDVIGFMQKTQLQQ